MTHGSGDRHGGREAGTFRGPGIFLSLIHISEPTRPERPGVRVVTWQIRAKGSRSD